MQPKTKVKLDSDSFNRIKKKAIITNHTYKSSLSDAKYCMKYPQEIGIQLTNKCNLRCKHCFEWSKNGYNNFIDKQEQNSEISIEIIEKVLKETQSENSTLFLWGGEPLVYTKWKELIELIDLYQRWTVICTNGIGLNNIMNDLVKVSHNIVLLTSLEGFEDVNDKIRGKGSFKKAIEGIDETIRLIKMGIFKGKQSIQCTINNDNIDSMYDFALYCENKGIDTLYYCYPWYISTAVAKKMDDFYESNIGKLKTGIKPSWYSFDFRISNTKIEELIHQINLINSREWNIRLRFQPAIEPQDVLNFVTGLDVPAQNKKACLAIRNRIDIMADGSVSTCKLFREFNVGNLYNNTLYDIWHGTEFNRMRELLSKSVMPVCSKCVLLYSNGV